LGHSDRMGRGAPAATLDKRAHVVEAFSEHEEDQDAVQGGVEPGKKWGRSVWIMSALPVSFINKRVFTVVMNSSGDTNAARDEIE